MLVFVSELKYYSVFVLELECLLAFRCLLAFESEFVLLSELVSDM